MYISKNYWHQFHKKKEHFSPYSSDENENKNHNLRVKDVTLSYGWK